MFGLGTHLWHGAVGDAEQGPDPGSPWLSVCPQVQPVPAPTMGTGLGNCHEAKPRAGAKGVPKPGSGDPSPSPTPLSAAQDLLMLKLVKELEPGEYSIFLKLTDGQGKAQVTTVKAQVCDCEGPAKNCKQRAFIAGGLGVPAILGILGGILALLSESRGMGTGMGLGPGPPSPHQPDAGALCSQSCCCCCCCS